MKLFRYLPFLLVVLGLSACRDPKLRTWATGVDQKFDRDSVWQFQTVYPGLRAYCMLERNVYDIFNAPQVPTLPQPPIRYCPPGGTDPVLPPPPPPNWDS
jgi:hypothetical protein